MLKRPNANSWAAKVSPEARNDLITEYHASHISCEEAAKRASELSGTNVTMGMFSKGCSSPGAALGSVFKSSWIALAARMASGPPFFRRSVSICSYSVRVI